MKFAEVTASFLKELVVPQSLQTEEEFDRLWSVVKQELARYSLELAPECDSLLRALVAKAVLNIPKKQLIPPLRGSDPLKPVIKAAVTSPTIVIDPIVLPHIQNEPAKYIVYGIQMQTSPVEELAEVSLRMVVLGMIKIAKEGGDNEITKQSFVTIKEMFCPLWPFWKKEDC